MYNLAALLRGLDVTAEEGILDIEVTGISYDSRKVAPGHVFVCIEGYKTDGHDYIRAALEKGAVALMIQKPVEVPAGIPYVQTTDTRKALALISSNFAGNPSDQLKMIGVTGTNGKTTTTYLIEQILKEKGYKVGLIGTIMNKIGDRVYPVTNTTPESLDLQLLLKEMVDEGITHVVMEVSSHALDLDRVYGIEYDTAVFTNITQDHLDFHKTMDKYLEAKQKLFANLDRYKTKNSKKNAIINMDDQASAKLIEASTGSVVTYGVNSSCQVKAGNISLRSDGVSFEVYTQGHETTLSLHLTGLFNVYNSLAAFAVGLAEDIAPEEIKAALESVKGVPGRMEKVDEGQDFAVLVDYAHTPDGLENIIKAARAFAKGRVITVFGCGGDRDRTKRAIMGELSGRLSDYSLLTSDNPRTEDPLFILSQIEEGIRRVVERDKYSILPDRREAIRYAVNMAQSGDVLLIAGKGHETYQLVQDQVLHFDDREVASELLKELPR